MSDAVDPWIVAARLATYGLALLVLGAECFPFYAPVAPRLRTGAAVRIAAPAALALATLAYLALLGREVSEAPGWPAPGVLAELVAATDFGRALAATLAAAVALLVLGVLAPSASWTRAFLAGAAVSALALIGHAADSQGLGRGVRIGLMALHLGAVGVWLGALGGLGAALRDRESAQRLLRRFGAVGAAAVALVVASGLGTLAFILADAHWNLGPSYRQALVVKLTFVAGLFTAAALNRFWLTPMTARDPDRALAAIRRTVVLEQALGLGAIASVALLGQLDPTM